LGRLDKFQDVLADTLLASFSDTGANTLGPNDAILGGSDTYTCGSTRSLSTNLADSGTSASPYNLTATDPVTQADYGSSTLTIDGHV
jgi:hypothetical protein